MLEGYIDRAGGALHYWRSGGPGNPIILAHGFSDNGLCWASMIGALAEKYDVVSVDARAHGHSFSPPGEWSIQDQAEDLLALVERLDLDEPVLMGHSMGGLAVFWATVARPDLPSAVVFEDSAIPRPGGDPGADAAAMRQGMQDWVGSLQAKSVEELITLCRENSPLWPEEDYRPWAESKLQLDLDAISRFSMFGDRDLGDHLPEIRCPALFLMADAGEEERARQRELAGRAPNARIEHVAGAGHNVRRDQHERTLELLADFLGAP